MDHSENDFYAVFSGYGSGNCHVFCFTGHRNAGTYTGSLSAPICHSSVHHQQCHYHHRNTGLQSNYKVSLERTVVFQSIRTLNLITALSEILILCISFRSYCSDSGAASDGCFIPSILLMMILLLACRYLAGVLIRILKEKTSALMQIDTALSGSSILRRDSGNI